MTQTYDPILETVELRRVRLSSPLRSPEMGAAMVLERAAGDPVVVHPGGRVPDARTGNYRRMHRVDTRIRGLAFTVSAPSSDAAFPFTITVRLACRIIDPVAIARDGVRDMTAALSPSLSAVVRAVAADFDAMRPTDAESAIVARLNSAYPLTTVELSGFTASVTMVDAAEIVTARREIRVHEMRREAMRDVASGGRDEMLAHIMALEGGNPMALLDRESEARESETKAQLDALRILMGSKMEDFNVAEVRKQALTKFFPGETDGATSGRRSVRERIERKPRAELDSGRVVEGNVPREAEPGKAEGPPPVVDVGQAPEDGRRSTRVRGTMRPSQNPDER